MRLATNLECADDLHAAGHTYYPTPQSVDFIRQIASSAMEGGGSWALEGPYGAGKSSLMAFALNQLACPTSKFKPCPHQGLFSSDDDPAKRTRNAGGLLPLTLTGSSESLVNRLLSTIKSFLEENPCVVDRRRLGRRKSGKNRVTADAALTELIGLASIARKSGKAGLLLVIDEFGRHIDHMLELEGVDDLYLLQSIAESTGRPDAPLSLVIVQHYGLDHYSNRVLGEKRSEWEKVRGRFRQTVLNNTETDTAHIVGQTLPFIEHGERRSIKEVKYRPPAKAPVMLHDTEFLRAASECRPLHPMTIILLSRLARLLGQQDRTVVGWLTSEMASGFVASAANADWVYPEALFDHFFGDTLFVPYNPVYARRVAAVQGAAERMSDTLSDKARTLFKVFAMLGFCGGRGIAADKSSAAACVPPHFPLERTLKELLDASLLVHRRYRGEYIVWEGSDYDILGRIDQAITLIDLDVAAELTHSATQSVLAHRHLIQTGNRRTARITWLNPGQPQPPETDEPRILIWLGKCPENVATTGDVRGSVLPDRVEPHLRAAAAIQELLDTDQDLREDRPARGEMRLRLDYHTGKIAAFVEEILFSPLREWRVGNEDFTSLQRAVTAAMDRAYPKAFKLHLDMLNRNRISGQISLALRKLIEALCENPKIENLGIKRFPAERIILEVFLKRNGLHTASGENGTWRLNISGKGLPNGLLSVLGEIRRHFSMKDAPVTVDSVTSALAKRPYGVRQYPTLLLCVLVLLAERDKYEIYEEGNYVPHWGAQTLIRMLKSPKRFRVSAAATAPVSAAFMSRYTAALAGDEYSSNCESTVAVARCALKAHARLSVHALQTEAIPEASRAFRRAIQTAKSPGDMLFGTIPKALGYRKLPSRRAEVKEYLAKVSEARKGLENAERQLLLRLSDMLTGILECSSLAEARTWCTERAESVLCDSRMHHGYDSFVDSVLADGVDCDEAWLRRVLDSGLGISLPLSSWSDSHAAQAEFALRRTLIAIQQAGHLLDGVGASPEDAPFIVFLPPVAELDPVQEEISALLESVPKEQRLPLIASLASTLRGDA